MILSQLTYLFRPCLTRSSITFSLANTASGAVIGVLCATFGAYNKLDMEVNNKTILNKNSASQM